MTRWGWKKRANLLGTGLMAVFGPWWRDDDMVFTLGALLSAPLMVEFIRLAFVTRGRR